MAKVVMETLIESDEALKALEEGADAFGDCLDVRGIEWVRSLTSTDRRKQVCVFEARDAETVRQAVKTSGMARLPGLKVTVWAATEESIEDE